MAITIEELRAVISADTQQLRVGVDQAKASVASLDSTVSGATASMGKNFAAIGTGIIAAFGITTLFRFGGAMASLVSDVDELRDAFTTLTGSSDSAKAKLASVMADANTLGISFFSLANQTKELAAASRGTTLSLEQQRQILLGVNEAGQALSLTEQQTTAVVDGLAKSLEQGTVTSRAFMAITNNMRGASDLLAESYGVTKNQLKKMVDDGLLPAEGFVKRVGAALRTEFSGPAKNAVEGFAESSARLKNAFATFVVATEDFLAKSGIVKFLTDAAEAAAALINKLAGVKQVGNDAAKILAIKSENQMERLNRLLGRRIELTKTITALEAQLSNKGLGDAGLAGIQKALALARQGLDQVNKSMQDNSKVTASLLKEAGTQVKGVAAEISVLADAGGPVSLASLQFKKWREELAFSKDLLPLLNLQFAELNKLFFSGKIGAEEHAKKIQDVVAAFEAMSSDALAPKAPEADGSAFFAGLGDIEVIRTKFEEQRALIEQELIDRQTALENYYVAGNLRAEEFEARQTQIQADAQQQRNDLLKQAVMNATGITFKSYDSQLATFASFTKAMLSGASKQHRGLFELQKAAAIAVGILDAKQAILSSYRFGAGLGGPILGATFAAVAAAASLANLNAIRSTSFGGGGGGGGSSSGGSVTPPSTVAAPGDSQPTGDSNGSATTQGTTAQRADRLVNITLQGAQYSQEQVVQLAEQLAELAEHGGVRINIQRTT